MKPSQEANLIAGLFRFLALLMVTSSILSGIFLGMAGIWWAASLLACAPVLLWMAAIVAFLARLVDPPGDVTAPLYCPSSSLADRITSVQSKIAATGDQPIPECYRAKR